MSAEEIGTLQRQVRQLHEQIAVLETGWKADRELSRYAAHTEECELSLFAADGEQCGDWCDREDEHEHDACTCGHDDALAAARRSSP